MKIKKECSIYYTQKNLAPRAGLEPATLRLTAECSAIELPRSINLVLAVSYSPTTRCGSTIAAERLNFCVRNGNRWNPFAITTKKIVSAFNKLHFQSYTTELILSLPVRSSPRPISTSQLRTLLPLHIWPINLIIYEGSY